MADVVKKRVHINFEGHKILDATSAVVTGSLQVTGSSVLTGLATMLASAQVTGSVSATGNVTGNTGSYSYVTSSGNLSVGGTATVQGASTLVGIVTTKASINTTGSIDLTGNVSGNSGSFNYVSSSGNLSVGGTATVQGAQTLVGITTHQSNVNITGSIDTTGNHSGNSGSFNYVSSSGNLSVGGTATVQGNATFNGTATVQGAQTLVGITTHQSNVNITGSVSATGNVTGNTGSYSYVTSSGNLSVGGTATVQGASTFVGSASFSNNVTVSGDLTVLGDTVTVNVATVRAEDKNIELAYGAGGTDAIADGGGITLIGTTNHTMNWSDTNDAWTFSEHMLPSTDAAKDLGISGTRWRDVIVSRTASAGTLTSTHLTVSQTASFAGPVTFSGVNTFNGSVTISAGNDLTVNGVKMTPIKASGSTNSSTAITLFNTSSLGIEDGQLVKGEVEVVGMSANRQHGATFKLSVAFHRSGSVVSGSATELSNETFGPSGALLDVTIETTGSNDGGNIKVGQTTLAGVTVYWYGQFTKKMVLDYNGVAQY